MVTAQRVDFEAIKARADFAAVLAHYGLRPVGQGDQVKILCPFHDETRPSCSVSLARRVFHCFGCGAAGNVLEFVHRMETRDGAAVSLRIAALELAAICGLEAGGGKTPETRRKARRGARAAGTRPTSSPGSNDAPGAAEGPGKASAAATRPAVNRPLGFTLTLDPEHPYLRERAVPAALAGLFGLGFCAKGSMAGRIAIPIHNAAGQLVAYAGRWAGPLDGLPEGEDKYKLPGGFQKGLELFNLHRVKDARHLVVVEGYAGAIRLHGLRIPAVAVMGSSISDEQVRLLLDHCLSLACVTVLMDGDAAGSHAADTIVPRLARHWWVRVRTLPDGTQPDTVGHRELARLLEADLKHSRGG